MIWARNDLLNLALTICRYPPPREDSYRHFPTIRPANSRCFSLRCEGRLWAGVGWTSACWLLPSLKAVKSKFLESNREAQTNSNHSRRTPPQSIPCSPMKATSKFRHQSPTEKFLVTFIDWKRKSVIIEKTHTLNNFFFFNLEKTRTLLTDSSNFSRCTRRFNFSWKCFWCIFLTSW